MIEFFVPGKMYIRTGGGTGSLEEWLVVHPFTAEPRESDKSSKKKRGKSNLINTRRRAGEQGELSGRYYKIKRP